ncbi:unnamed protein product, partial [Ascophyllum nodosum]
GRHLRANGKEGPEGCAGTETVESRANSRGRQPKDVGRSLGENILVGSAKLLLVSQLFIVDAGVSLELFFSVFLGQCACLYVRDDFFRFCTSTRKLSLSTLLCRRNDGAKNKKM